MACGAIPESLTAATGRTAPMKSVSRAYRSFLKNNIRRQLIWQEIVDFFVEPPRPLDRALSPASRTESDRIRRNSYDNTADPRFYVKSASL
jgi:hypothetical protein